jgi:hypothetical protein
MFKKILTIIAALGMSLTLSGMEEVKTQIDNCIKQVNYAEDQLDRHLWDKEKKEFKQELLNAGTDVAKLKEIFSGVAADLITFNENMAKLLNQVTTYIAKMNGTKLINGMKATTEQCNVTLTNITETVKLINGKS